jgi:hypothetical protein
VDSLQHQKALAQLLEKLASIEHERWAHWQKYMHEKGELLPDGSLKLPAELVGRWQTQIETPYNELTEGEKDSDREQVRKYLPLLERWLQDAMKGERGE